METTMTAERFRQIRNVFDAALERDPSDRVAFLDEACHGDDDLRIEVEQLLISRDQQTGWLDSAAVAGERLEGRRIGPYEILRTLGEGGMGTVYLAARADGAFRKLVALKIVRPESATAEVLRRFQQEREILASLEHRNIARILDGGETADGLPYLVMEYVEGKPIDLYCNEHRLTVRQRLVLFDQVCSAVGYAHTRHVIHRDLKPSNVLVTADGEVKLLDFGIAKLLGEGDETALLTTRSDLRLMTPEYASPEQVRGESVTAASDIYTLGVLLYELLTGRRPYRLRSRIFHEVVRIICEEPPTKPSTVVTERREVGDDPDRAPEALSRMRGVSPKDLRRELAGNLDGILLRSLQKDPPQRYKSVAELSEELQSHMRGEPVQARRGATLKALLTFAQRYPLLVLAVIAVALAGWNGWIPTTVWFVGIWLVVSVAIGFWIGGRMYGTRTMPKPIMKMTLQNMGVCGLLVFVCYALLKGSLQLDFFTILEFLTAIIIVPTLYMLLRWPLRRKLMGPLVLDASGPRNRFVVVSSIVVVALYGGAALSAAIADFAHQDAGQFVYFHVANRPPGTVQSGYSGMSFPITGYAVLSEQHEIFSTVIAFAPLSTAAGIAIQFRSESGKAFGEEVTGNLFSDLHLPLYLGRGFTIADEMRSAKIVVLSYDSWNRRFASDPSVIGQRLYVRGQPFTIIGVAPPSFRGIDPYHATDFWVPLQTGRALTPWGDSPGENYTLYTSSDWYCLLLVGRLRPGITPQEAGARLAPSFQSVMSTGVTSVPNKPQLYFSPANGVGDWSEHSAHNASLQHLHSSLIQLLLWTMFMIWRIWFFHRLELRAQGVASGTAFIPWRRVAGYSWEHRLGEIEMLRLRLNGIWKWSPIPVHMLVKRNLRPQVDQVLKQQLMEWPMSAAR